MPHRGIIMVTPEFIPGMQNTNREKPEAPILTKAIPHRRLGTLLEKQHETSSYENIRLREIKPP